MESGVILKNCAKLAAGGVALWGLWQIKNAIKDSDKDISEEACNAICDQLDKFENGFDEMISHLENAVNVPLDALLALKEKKENAIDGLGKFASSFEEVLSARKHNKKPTQDPEIKEIEQDVDEEMQSVRALIKDAISSLEKYEKRGLKNSENEQDEK